MLPSLPHDLPVLPVTTNTAGFLLNGNTLTYGRPAHEDRKGQTDRTKE